MRVLIEQHIRVVLLLLEMAFSTSGSSLKLEEVLMDFF